MGRLLLFVAVGWLISKIVGVLFRSVTRPHQEKRSQKDNFAEPKSTEQIDFRDVQDAQFEDITEKEKVTQ